MQMILKYIPCVRYTEFDDILMENSDLIDINLCEYKRMNLNLNLYVYKYSTHEHIRLSLFKMYTNVNFGMNSFLTLFG